MRDRIPKRGSEKDARLARQASRIPKKAARWKALEILAGAPFPPSSRPGRDAAITGELPAPEEEPGGAKTGALIGGIAGAAGGIAAGAALAGSIGVGPAILAGVGVAAAGALLGLGIGALVSALSGGSVAAQRNARVVKVSPEIPAVNYDHSLSGAEIRAKSTSPSPADRAGLTRAPLFGRLELTPAFDPGRKQDGKFAYWIHNLEFIYGFRELIVWIAKEYPVGSCEYQVTLDHEKEHVALDQRLVRESEAKIRQAMLEFTPLPTKEQPLWVATEAEGDAAVEAIKAAVAAKSIGPLYDKLRADLHQGNRDLDTPANYQKVYSRCSNW